MRQDGGLSELADTLGGKAGTFQRREHFLLVKQLHQVTFLAAAVPRLGLLFCLAERRDLARKSVALGVVLETDEAAPIRCIVEVGRLVTAETDFGHVEQKQPARL